jgi:hypothetical protein
MVEAPSEATALQTVVGNLTIQTAIQVDNVIPYKSDTWRIHSDSLTITEEQAGEIVDRVAGFYWMDYDGFSRYDLATLSYRSLLRSLQINSRVINLVRI